MENVSKALLMAAGVLIAVLLLAIATLLFRAGNGFAEAYQKSNEEIELNTFNSNFLNMVSGYGDDSITTINIHNIITVANFAWNNNCKYVDNPIYASETEDDPRMLRVHLMASNGTAYIVKDLQNYTQQLYDILVKNGYYYDYGSDTRYPFILHYDINIARYSAVGRINLIKFNCKVESGLDASSKLTSNLPSDIENYKRNSD